MNSPIHSDDAPNPIGPYSQAILANGVLFCSGQIGIDPATGELVPGGFLEEARQVFKNIEAVLTKANFTFANVVRVDLYLKNMSDYASIKDIYTNTFAANPALPARTTVEVSDLPKGALIEITCIAA